MTTNPNTKNLDSSVIITFLVTAILAGGYFVYRYYLKTNNLCPDVSFSISDINPTVGESVDFMDLSQGTVLQEWDFGDNSTAVVQNNPTHIFQFPGEYTVKLTVNNSCIEYKKIIISPEKSIAEEVITPSFFAPKRTKVGEKVEFNDLTTGAKKWEWHFGETGKVDAKSKDPIYMFTKAGKYTITLIVNDDLKNLAKKDIIVQAKDNVEVKKSVKRKPEPKPFTQKTLTKEEPKTYTSEHVIKKEVVDTPEVVQVINDDELVLLLTDYSSGNKSSRELTPYFCAADLSTMVKANGDLMRLSDLLEKIGGKEIKIKNMFTFREDNKCIQRFEMKYTKKGVF